MVISGYEYRKKKRMESTVTVSKDDRSDMTPYHLDCGTCEATGDFVDGRAAYDAGWMFDGKPICPTCMIPRDKKAHDGRVKKYGREATERGERIFREKHGR